MDGTQPRVVSMGYGIREGLTEATSVDEGYTNPKQAELKFTLRIQRGEDRLDPLERPE